MASIARLAGLVLVVAAVGCASTSQQQIEESDVRQIQKGVTTQDDILVLLGEPDVREYSSKKGESVWKYFRESRSAKQNVDHAIGSTQTAGRTAEELSGTRIDVPRLPNVGRVTGSSGQSERSAISIKFDENGVVTDYKYASRSGR